MGGSFCEELFLAVVRGHPRARVTPAPPSSSSSAVLKFSCCFFVSSHVKKTWNGQLRRAQTKIAYTESIKYFFFVEVQGQPGRVARKQQGKGGCQHLPPPPLPPQPWSKSARKGIPGGLSCTVRAVSRKCWDRVVVTRISPRSLCFRLVQIDWEV